MSTRLLLEGSTIEEVLAQVRAEHGDNARIVHADKVRSGGFAGFFAKEKFEVAVEVEGELPDPEPETAPLGALDILGLVEDADAADESGLRTVSGRVRTLSTAYAAAEPPAPDPTRTTSSRARVERPALAADDDSPLVSTTSDSFARVLAALSRGVEDEPAARAAKLAPAAVPDLEPEAEDVRARAAFVSVLADAAAAQPTPPVAPAPVAPAPAAPVPEAPASVATAPVPAAGVASLAALGVPAGLLTLPTELGADLETAAVLVAAQIRSVASTALPPGSLVAVVGPGREAYVAARALAALLGVRAESVVLAATSTLHLRLAADRRVAVPADAGPRGQSLRRSDAPVVVAVDASSPADAVPMLQALGAESVLLVADAGRKLADLRRHAEVFGADGLVVVNAAATVTPGEVLALNLPVAMVDGTASGPIAWARLLVAAAAEHEDE